MPKPASTRRVTVYYLDRYCRQSDALAIRFHRRGVVYVTNRGGGREQLLMAAEAWVKCEGVRRREYLIGLNAPEFIIRGQTDVEEIAQEMTPSPSGKLWSEGYIHDNQCESWLMGISMGVRRMRQSRRDRAPVDGDDNVGNVGNDVAWPWYLWLPTLN